MVLPAFVVEGRQQPRRLSTTVKTPVVFALSILVSTLTLTPPLQKQSACLYMFLSMSKPLTTLSRERPHTSPFSLYALSSVGLQALVHLGFLVVATARAKAHAGWEVDLEGGDDGGVDLTMTNFSDVVVSLDSNATETETEISDPETSPSVVSTSVDGDFTPTVVNSVAFVASSLIMLSTFATNYVGIPFNEPLTSNRPLLWTLLGGSAVFWLAASDLARPLSDALELTPLPRDFRGEMVTLSVVDALLAYLMERLARVAFPASGPTL